MDVHDLRLGLEDEGHAILYLALTAVEAVEALPVTDDEAHNKAIFVIGEIIAHARKNLANNQAAMALLWAWEKGRSGRQRARVI